MNNHILVLLLATLCVCEDLWERNSKLLLPTITDIEKDFDLLSSGSSALEGNYHKSEQKAVGSSNSTRTQRSSTIGNFQSNEVKRFAEECLFAHNQYRKKHNVHPLQLSEELNRNSQKWADYLANTNRFEHTPNNKYGENLYKLWTSQKIGNLFMKGSEPVRNWYEKEIPYFKFGRKNSDYMKTGHFSQVIWANSKYIGVGVAKSPDGNSIYVVCQYDPPGNYVGQYDVNVPPIRADMQLASVRFVKEHTPWNTVIN